MRCHPGGVLVAFLVLGGLGVASGCLTTLAPNIHPRAHHRGVTASDEDHDCLMCHEPELAAQRRLMAMTPERREQTMRWMEREGGAALVAQWMIDDPRGCQGCHALRGRPR